jgi:glutamine phosphoribosylpyrophosphate amidotransferase
MSDKFHDECAVMGVYGHPEAANMVYLGLYALQHRGQESCGIVSSDSRVLTSHRQMGLVADAFKEEVIKRLEGASAISKTPNRSSSNTHKARSRSRIMATSSTLPCCAKSWNSRVPFSNRQRTLK